MMLVLANPAIIWKTQPKTVSENLDQTYDPFAWVAKSQDCSQGDCCRLTHRAYFSTKYLFDTSTQVLESPIISLLEWQRCHVYMVQEPARPRPRAG